VLLVDRGEDPSSYSSREARCMAQQHRMAAVTCAVGCDVKLAVFESSRLTYE
jgi:hypothetical protein